MNGSRECISHATQTDERTGGAFDRLNANRSPGRRSHRGRASNSIDYLVFFRVVTWAISISKAKSASSFRNLARKSLVGTCSALTGYRKNGRRNCSVSAQRRKHECPKSKPEATRHTEVERALSGGTSFPCRGDEFAPAEAGNTGCPVRPIDLLSSFSGGAAQPEVTSNFAPTAAHLSGRNSTSKPSWRNSSVNCSLARLSAS